MKMIGANACNVRRINRDLLLEAIKREAGLNIAGLSSRTRLSVSTCGNILRELVKTGEVLVREERVSSGGRPAKQYIYNPNHSCIVCVLLQCTMESHELVYSVIDASGRELDHGTRVTTNMDVTLLDDVLSHLSTQYLLTTVAVALPGVIHKGVITESDISALVGMELAEHVKKRHGVEVVVDNDTNFAAVSYYRTNSEARAASLAFLAFPQNRCPGCGLVVNNMLVKGSSDYAGEIGSIMPLLFGRLENGNRPTEFIVGTLAAIIIAVVNPSVVVIAGETIRPDMRAGIEEVCMETIPKVHMPRIIAQNSFMQECFTGMRIMAFNLQTCEYKLIETDGAWC